MSKKIGLFWLKDDFRVTKNFALAEATKNHDQVVAFYLYKKTMFEEQIAQKWWVSRSLEEFKKKLDKYNIQLEIIKVDSFKIFFEELLKRSNFSIYWNKTYEPQYLSFDEFISKKLKSKNIKFKIFKGNILNEFYEIKKSDSTPFKVFTPFWRIAEKFYLDKIPSFDREILKRKKKISFFKNSINEKKILPEKRWHSKFEEYWYPSEEKALLKLKEFIKNAIEKYSDARNFPSVLGTSKLSPFIKHGQIHVETIWQECKKIKKKR